MNELIFFSHLLVILGAVVIALRLGKEALISLFILLTIVANLFVTKEMVCFGFTITCTDAYTVGAMLIMNLIQELYGKKVAGRILVSLFFLLALFVVMGQIHLQYHPAKSDVMHGAFKQILALTPRTMFVSIGAGLLAQKIGIELFGRLRQKMESLPFWIPFALAAAVTQLIDTTLYTYGALYGILHNMGDIIAISYLIKLTTIAVMAPCTLFMKKWMRDDTVQV